MKSSTAYPGLEPCVSEADFKAMKKRFKDVGDCLTDQQLLELADCYHGILRWRRALRARHAVRHGTPPCAPEAKSFACPDGARDSIWDEARDVIAATPSPYPP